jgi:hypothetical protein
MRKCWNLKLSSLALACLAAIHAFGQFNNPTRDGMAGSSENMTYQFPFNPGQPNQLAGTMGELRSNHFHAGIDIRTNNTVGLPILAAADGYVSRISSSPFGYGNVIYLAHPNGQTTVYGHLDQFKGAVASHLLKEQYARKSFEIDLTLEPHQFKVTKGDTIGLSGNTGGSNGPHLHFEIRNENNEAINPLTFGFKEVNDLLAPLAQKIALRTLDQNSRINDQFGRFEFYLIRNGNNFSLSKPILASGRIGIELLAHDKVDKAHFRCGINYIELFADDQKIFQQKIETIDFQKTRQILAVMDYPTLKTKGSRFNKLYIDAGNQLPFYDSSLSGGFVHVADKTVQLKALLKDISGNTSTVSFQLKPSPIVQQVPTLGSVTKPIDFEVHHHTLIVTRKASPTDSVGNLDLYENGIKYSFSVSYFNQNRHVFLIDLKRHQPDSVVIDQFSLPLFFAGRIPSGIPYTFYSNWADITFKSNSLYDTLYLQLYRKKGPSEIYAIGTRLTPLFNHVTIRLKTEKEYGPKAAVYNISGGYDYLGGKIENGKMEFSTRELGDFAILEDTVPPTIYRIRCTPTSARFRIRDNLSGIAEYEANINGEWLLMTYDYKTGIIQSQRKDGKLLKGDFQLRVTDRSGNVKIYTQKIL